MADIEVIAEPESTEATVAVKRPVNGVCPVCKTPAPAIGKLLSKFTWKEQVKDAKQTLGVGTDEEALDLVLQRHGGYIAECEKEGCGTSFLVKF